MCDSSNILVACIECGEKIQKSARLCRHCKTPQNWSRLLFRWKDILVAVLALTPLWGGAYALLLPIFENNIPILKIIDASCDSDKPIFLLSNQGSASAIVKTVGLRFKEDKISDSYEYILRPDIDGESTEWIELLPKTTEPIRFVTTSKGAMVPLPRDLSGSKRIVVIDYIDLNGNEYYDTSTWPCKFE